MFSLIIVRITLKLTTSGAKNEKTKKENENEFVVVSQGLKIDKKLQPSKIWSKSSNNNPTDNNNNNALHCIVLYSTLGQADSFGYRAKRTTRFCLCCTAQAGSRCSAVKTRL